LKTQVAIIGGGPSGLLLGQLLLRHGIDTVILERRTRTHVLSRIRAGVLERGLVDLLREAGVADRLEREGIRHDGTLISFDDEMFRVDFTRHTGHAVTVYGQTEVTRDLYAAREASGGKIEFEAEDVAIHDATGEAPYLTYRVDGAERRLDCEFIAGCDGFHGVSRAEHPDRHPPRIRKGLSLRLARHPVRDAAGRAGNPDYANSERGFALCSMRNEGSAATTSSAP
jgi:p-hydroxybenzoate 3-monooxygenase